MQAFSIRRFQPTDATAVRAMFIEINRDLAPEGHEAAFERYIDMSLAEEIDRIEAYYGERRGSFHVVISNGLLIGMLGLEPAGEEAMELRRMYVDRRFRGSGVASAMLVHAEGECRRTDCLRLVLSTSERQKAALAFYRRSGFRQLHEEIAEAASNKTVGGGIRRFHFEKRLKASATA